MTLTDRLEYAILSAARDRIRKHERAVRRAKDEHSRRLRRSTLQLAAPLATGSDRWALRPEHDPYHVRAKARVIAHSMSAALQQRSYTPLEPLAIAVPKRSGELRYVNSYAIADEVVSRMVFDALVRKNHSRFSARSYAYRPDRGVHDAVDFIHTELRRYSRVYVAEYDFSSYFDCISHEWIWKTLADLRFSLTPLETTVIEAFLTSRRYTSPSPGAPFPHLGAQLRGVPQGTAISLALANIAATPLDLDLERIGVGFARYADDTLIWSSSYEKTGQAADALHRHAGNMGVGLGSERATACASSTRPEPAQRCRAPMMLNF